MFSRLLITKYQYSHHMKQMDLGLRWQVIGFTYTLMRYAHMSISVYGTHCRSIWQWNTSQKTHRDIVVGVQHFDWLCNNEITFLLSNIVGIRSISYNKHILHILFLIIMLYGYRCVFSYTMISIVAIIILHIVPLLYLCIAIMILR